MNESSHEKSRKIRRARVDKTKKQIFRARILYTLRPIIILLPPSPQTD